MSETFGCMMGEKDTLALLEVDVADAFLKTTQKTNILARHVARTI